MGAYKPRTSPYDFQGLGEEGLRHLRRAGDEHRRQYTQKRALEQAAGGNLDLLDGDYEVEIADGLSHSLYRAAAHDDAQAQPQDGAQCADRGSARAHVVRRVPFAARAGAAPARTGDPGRASR